MVSSLIIYPLQFALFSLGVSHYVFSCWLVLSPLLSDFSSMSVALNLCVHISPVPGTVSGTQCSANAHS